MISIYSQTFKEHLDHVRKVMEKLARAGLKINLDKCSFFKTDIHFLGHIVRCRGIRPDEEKVEKIKNYAVPRTLCQLWAFLGLASYFQRFIKGFAALARPLYTLFKKNIKYEWKEEQQKAFEKLKTHLISAPILQYPDFSRTFYLHTDASGTGLGAVLVQKNKENKDHVIAYTSRGLLHAERNYSATELECLAVLWAVEYYRHYFGFRPFVVVTDHVALKWLHTSKLNGRRAR